MSNTLDSSGSYIPKDLLKSTDSNTVNANAAADKNVFTFIAPNLKIDSVYTFQFQYVFEDGVESDWSPSKLVVIGAEPIPGAPVITATGGAGFIKVTLATFPANAFRVDIRISGGTFGGGTVVVDSFTSAGTKTITAAGGSGIGVPYTVSAVTVSPTKTGIASNPVTVYVTDPTANIVVEPSVTPSVPTVSSTLGAIQLAWNGKTATGGDQPSGFVAAKVYVGTSSGFTPIDTGSAGANQVDVLNFANGQNTLNIAVGTLVNNVEMDYGIDYYIKIKTTNGNAAEDSAAVLATGSPVRIGQVNDGDIVEVKFDKLRTGTLTSQVLTVGAATGKHVKLSGSGDPLTIYGTGGTSDPLLSFSTNGLNQSVLTIKGNGTFSGDISAASGTFTGSLKAGVNNYQVITNAVAGIGANAGRVVYSAKTILTMGETISVSGIASSNPLYTITKVVGDGSTVIYTSANNFSVGETVTISGVNPSQYNLKGVITARTPSEFRLSSNKTGAYISGGVVGYPHVFDINNATIIKITDAAGTTFATSAFATGLDVVVQAGTDIYAESFTVLSSTTGTYTSGGSLVKAGFEVAQVTGQVRASSGIIGGWQIEGSKLKSSGTSNRIELDPLTPAITLFNSTGSNIQISASNGITHSSGSFNLTAAGNLTISGVITANSGSNIAGWQTTSSSITSGGISLNSAGSIVSTGTIASPFNTTTFTTSTLSSGYLDVFSNENTVAFLGMSDGLTSGAGAIIRNNTNSFTATAVGISLKVTSTQNGVTPGGFYITHASGDYLVHLGFYDDSTFPTSRKLKFDHWGNSAQRTQDNAAIAYDTATQSLRPMVIDSDGTAYLGWSQYFSTTLQTTPSSGTGQNGDIYLSTA